MSLSLLGAGLDLAKTLVDSLCCFCLCDSAILRFWRGFIVTAFAMRCLAFRKNMGFSTLELPIDSQLESNLT